MERFSNFRKLVVANYLNWRFAIKIAAFTALAFGLWLPSQYEYEKVIPRPIPNWNPSVSDCRFPRQPTPFEKVYLFYSGKYLTEIPAAASTASF